MKKIVMIFVLMMLVLVGCGEVQEPTVISTPTIEPIGVEHVEVEHIETENIVSDEYLQELEYNSRNNDWD